MNGEFDAAFLEKKARKLRRDVIKMITAAGSGHPGGALSAMDVITYLYYYRMNIDPKNPKWAERDRFILSKGHCCPALYAALADKGYFDEGELATLREVGSMLQGHPDMNKTPGVDMTAGSLGQGLSVAVGMALGGRIKNRKYSIYVMTGDGELQSGQIWEAAMAAGNYRLDSITMIVDNNHLQCDGATSGIMDVEPIDVKLQAFGWETCRADGHSFEEIHKAFEELGRHNGKPGAIIADTVKGKGVSFMEGSHLWHGLAPTREQEAQALKELGDGYDD